MEVAAAGTATGMRAAGLAPVLVSHINWAQRAPAQSFGS
jgi:hypothetical protein